MAFGAERFDTGVRLDEEGPPRRPSEPQDLVNRMIEEAIDWREAELEPEQEKATEYYMGEPFGDEEEGRSQVVSTDVRDAVQSMLPSLMRVFFGPDNVVEFRPRGPEDVEEAEQQTDYVDYVVQQDNDGFLAFHAAFKDALVRKLGVIKWWWDEKIEVHESDHSGLTEQEVAFLRSVDGVEVEITGVQEGRQQADPETGEPVQVEPNLFDVHVRRVEEDGRARIAAVPPEEFIFSPEARSLEDARLVGHVREVPADELIAMGVDEELVNRAKKKKERIGGPDSLEGARRIDDNARRFEREAQDDSTLPVRFADVYVRLDLNDDGLSELRHIQAVGPDSEFAFNEVVDEIPFALFGPDPEPHTMVGLSVADYVMDLQRIKSALQRGMLDSLTLTLNPATEVVEGEVNMADVLNPEVGRVIRTRKPGMMREITTPFVGKEALPVLQYMDELKENRTGLSKAAAGLDADALQSSTKAAVAATLSAAQQRIEMIARIFAETGMKRLFKGLLKLVTRHQDRERVIRLRNKYVQVDPRHWNAEKDVTINVALGAGMTEEKLQTLAMIAEKQELLIKNGAPLVTFREYRNTLSRMVELAGFSNPDEFFRPFGEKEQAQFQQAQAQKEQEPSEAEMLAQVEMAKIQADQAQEKAKLALDAQKTRLEDDRERDELARDFIVELLKTESDVEQSVIESRVELARQALDRDLAAADFVKEVTQGLEAQPPTEEAE